MALGFGYYPTHPGDVLKDEIEYRGISQRELARVMEIPYTALNEMLNAKRPISATSALLFEAALGVPAYSLMNLQSKYDMQMALQNKQTRNWISSIQKGVAALW